MWHQLMYLKLTQKQAQVGQLVTAAYERVWNVPYNQIIIAMLRQQNIVFLRAYYFWGLLKINFAVAIPD